MPIDSGYHENELHEDTPYIRDCDNRCGHMGELGTFGEDWHDGSKWITGRLWRFFKPMICTKCKDEFEENDRLVKEQLDFETSDNQKLILSLTEGN